MLRKTKPRLRPAVDLNKIIIMEGETTTTMKGDTTTGEIREKEEEEEEVEEVEEAGETIMVVAAAVVVVSLLYAYKTRSRFNVSSQSPLLPEEIIIIITIATTTIIMIVTTTTIMTAINGVAIRETTLERLLRLTRLPNEDRKGRSKLVALVVQIQVSS